MSNASSSCKLPISAQAISCRAIEIRGKLTTLVGVARFPLMMHEAPAPLEKQGKLLKRPVSASASH
ncbi:hypothetical protein ACP6JB_003238 [Aspergillus fumigatus]